MDLVIEDVPEHVVQLLKLRADRAGRSLQDELMIILKEAAEETPQSCDTQSL